MLAQDDFAGGIAESGDASANQNFIFLQHCPDQEEDRYRLCDVFYREAFVHPPDAAVYFLGRLNDLRTSAYQNASSIYYWYFFSLIIFLILSLVAMLLFIIRSKSGPTGAVHVKWHAIISAAAIALLALVGSMGWLGRFQAEQAVYLKLTALRDTVETHLVFVALSADPVDEESLEEWLAIYRTIMGEHADSYTGSYALPDTGDLATLVGG